MSFTGRKTSELGGWYVSYWRRWWDPRRLYACGNVSEIEARETARYLIECGAYGIRIQGPTSRVQRWRPT